MGKGRSRLIRPLGHMTAPIARAEILGTCELRQTRYVKKVTSIITDPSTTVLLVRSSFLQEHV